MSAFLIVRADVAEADRDGFDRWYETEHLPQAKAAFHAKSARRGWSDDGSHLALYEFADLASARAVVGSDEMRQLIAEFDRAWPAVQRSREVVEISQTL